MLAVHSTSAGPKRATLRQLGQGSLTSLRRTGVRDRLLLLLLLLLGVVVLLGLHWRASEAVDLHQPAVTTVITTTTVSAANSRGRGDRTVVTELLIDSDRGDGASRGGAAASGDGVRASRKGLEGGAVQVSLTNKHGAGASTAAAGRKRAAAEAAQKAARQALDEQLYPGLPRDFDSQVREVRVCVGWGGGGGAASSRRHGVGKRLMPAGPVRALQPAYS
jgi:hypothetical protein